MDTLQRYVLAIRNPTKRWYAEECLKHIFQRGPEPKRPTELSFMAAQAVRMNLKQLWDQQVQEFQGGNK